MRKIYFIILVCSFFWHKAESQPFPVNSQQFFLDTSVLEVTITTDIKKLRTEKKVPQWQPANIIMRFSDSSTVNEDIRIEPRGIYRKAYCDMASLMLNFKNTSSPKLSPLKKLKLVGSCRSGGNEEFLLKEYLCYKLYNLISIMSFRARLMHITYIDSKQKVKTYSQYGFLIEDMKDMAERNNCVEIKKRAFATEATNRQQITLVSIFQYMIGNTDWLVRNYHNIKLMVPKTDTFARPYPIPYDFDYAGLVDAPYATPDENLGTEKVTERYYLGFARAPEELEPILNIFKEKKESIFLTVSNFSLLSTSVKKEMARYLDQFFFTIENKNAVRETFISNALKN